MQGEVSTDSAARVRPRWDRRTRAVMMAEYERASCEGLSQRAFAAASGVPRTTLQAWEAHKATLDAEPSLVEFLESPTGLAFLHRQIGALHFVFGHQGLCGVDLICQWLELTRVDVFVGASYGAQRTVAADVTSSVVSFAPEQRPRLAAQMPPRTIALAEDETFPEGIWLVAMDPASGFIVLEQAADSYDAATWTAAITEATCDLKVTIAVSAADEAPGLAAHAAAIGAHHAPDLFHVQRPLWQAMVRPLVRSLEYPAAALARAAAVTASWRERWDRHLTGLRSVGRPPDFERHLAAAQAAEDQARQANEDALAHKDNAYAAIRRLSTAYHPVDPDTGALRDAACVQADLEGALTTIHAAATAIRLPSAGRKLLAKAGRVIPKMVATIAFFFAELDRQLDQLHLPPAVHDHARRVLLPAAYLARLAQRAATVADRQTLLAVRQDLILRGDAACLAALLPEQRRQLDAIVLTCVDLFARSTSCVEGRNGRLALWHHHLHRLSSQRLASLTIIHNYWLRRRDGTTAAERFFGHPPDDLFDWILDRLDMPARPTAAPARLAAA